MVLDPTMASFEDSVIVRVVVWGIEVVGLESVECPLPGCPLRPVVIVQL